MTFVENLVVLRFKVQCSMFKVELVSLSAVPDVFTGTKSRTWWIQVLPDRSGQIHSQIFAEGFQCVRDGLKFKGLEDCLAEFC